MPSYDPQQLLVTLGPIKVDGFADTMVKIARNSDSSTLTVGAQGDVARAINRDDTGTVEITLLPSSFANQFLTGMHELDRLPFAGGGGTQPLKIVDASTGAEFFMSEAWIKKAPEAEYNKEVGSRTWVLEGKWDTYEIAPPV